MGRALAKRGHHVDLLVSSKKNSLFILKNKINKRFNVFLLPRLNVHRLINGKILRGVLACFFIIFKKYDIIHIFESVQFETNIPLVLGKLLKKKVILDIDEEWLETPAYHDSSGLMKLYIKLCDLSLAPKFNFMTVTSEYLVKKFQKLGVENILKIINGPDFGKFRLVSRQKARKRLKIDQKEKMILAFGNTYLGGRNYLLLKAFQEVVKLDNTVKLYFNDPQPFLKDPKIKKEIKSSVIKNVVITGYIPDKDLPYYLGASDLTMFLTKDTNGERACYPGRLGAYLNGKRVVAINRTRTEGYRSLAQFDCVLTGDTPAEVARQIIKFFKNKKFRRQKEVNVLKARKKLNWDYTIKGLEKFYQQRLEN